ncbi:hypothetical protein FRB99_006989 [Tulasnella sp. 403]|nr:hypothetical protein FRB99_006989 [Tulasnella sp. 403]
MSQREDTSLPPTPAVMFLWTGIWKALGNSKADIVKMVEAQPELASQLRRVRGGYLKIQGTWLPYEVALRLARRVAWPIRQDLVPLFGPNFPDTCLAPDQPGYGQVVASSGRRPRRSKYQPPADNDSLPPAQPDLPPSSSSPYGAGASSTAYHYRHPQHTYSPSSAASPESPVYDSSPVDHPGSYYQLMPSSAPGPSNHPRSHSHAQPHQHGHQHSDYYLPSSEDVSPQAPRNPSSTSRHRYAPYPPSSIPSPGPNASTPRQDQYTPLPPSDVSPYSNTSNERSTRGPPQRDTRYDLPPLATIDLPRDHRPPPSIPSSQPSQPPAQQPSFSLPPITSLRHGDKPEMDASTVLRRLRLDDERPVKYEGSRTSLSPQPPYQPAYPPGPPSYHGDPNYPPPQQLARGAYPHDSRPQGSWGAPPPSSVQPPPSQYAAGYAPRPRGAW